MFLVRRVIKCSKFVVLKCRVKGLDWKLKPPTLNSISLTTALGLLMIYKYMI